MNVKTDRRHDRRALSVDESRWLLDATENARSVRGADGKLFQVPAIERFGMSGAARAVRNGHAVD